jgi:hypothetical protein
VYEARILRFVVNNTVIMRVKEIVNSAANATALPYIPGTVTRDYIEPCIPKLHFSQTIKSEGDCRIEMTSRPFAQGDITIAIAVAPWQTHEGSASNALEIDCRTIEAGCCSNVATTHVTNR